METLRLGSFFLATTHRIKVSLFQKPKKCGLKGVMAWSVLIAAGRPRGGVFIGMYVDPVFAS